MSSVGAPASVVQAYKVLPPEPTAEGQLFARILDGAKDYSRPLGLAGLVKQIHVTGARGEGGLLLRDERITSAAPRRIAILHSSDSTPEVLVRDETAGSSAAVPSASDVALEVDGGLKDMVSGEMLVERLPLLEPDPTAGGYPRGYKGRVKAGATSPQVIALLETKAAGKVAALATGRAAALLFMQTDEVVAIPRINYIAAASVAADDLIYIVGWNGYATRPTVELIVANAARRVIAGREDLGIDAADSVNEVLLPGPAGSIVLGLFSKQADAVRPDVRRYRAGKAEGSRILVEDQALNMTLVGEGKAFIFGGAKGNKVGLLHLDNGRYEAVLPALTAPEGSVIVGLAKVAPGFDLSTPP